MKIFSFNLFRQNTMVLHGCGNQCILIDPAYYTDSERDIFYAYLDENSLKPTAILLTHGHLDHIFGVAEAFRNFGCPVYLNQADKKVLDYDSEIGTRLGLRRPDIGFPTIDAVEGRPIQAAGFTFNVIETPGHTDGSVCYYEAVQKILFSGDTLFAGTIGRTDLEFGNYDSIIKSIMEKLMPLPGDVEVFPGHGPATTIAEERNCNPMLEPFNEPEDE